MHLAVFILEEDKMVDETFRDVIQDELRLTYKFYVQVSVLATFEAFILLQRKQEKNDSFLPTDSAHSVPLDQRSQKKWSWHKLPMKAPFEG